MANMSASPVALWRSAAARRTLRENPKKADSSLPTGTWSPVGNGARTQDGGNESQHQTHTKTAFHSATNPALLTKGDADEMSRCPLFHQDCCSGVAFFSSSLLHYFIQYLQWMIRNGKREALYDTGLESDSCRDTESDEIHSGTKVDALGGRHGN